MNAPNPKLIAKLRRMLDIGRDARTTEAEANIAMETAQRMMRDHNLSMAVLESASGKTAEGRVKDESKINLLYLWKQNLFRAIARTNFCHFEVVKKTTSRGERIGGGYELIGRESNVVAVRNMFEYLCQAIERLVVDEVGRSPQDRYTKYAHSFRLGCVERLQERLTERHDQELAKQRAEAEAERVRRAHPAAAASSVDADGRPFFAPVVILEDYAEQERDLNTDLRYGLEPGTTARNRRENKARWAIESAERNERRAALKAELIAQGIPADVADYMTLGYDEATARKICKPKTAAQQRKQDERDARANERYWRGVHSRERKQRAAVDQTGFNAGRDAGDDISLNDQVDRRETKRLA